MARKKDKPSTYSFTENELKNTISRCIDNIQGLLESADFLRKAERTVQYALGLYMYAVEEYGKAHLLKSYLVQDRSNFLVPSWIFGRCQPPSGKISATKNFRKDSEAFLRIAGSLRTRLQSLIIGHPTLAWIQSIRQPVRFL